MIAALLQKLNEIEKRVYTQEKDVQNIRAKYLDTLFTQSEDETDSTKCEIKPLLFRFQAQLKEQTFGFNELKAKVTCQASEIEQIKSDLLTVKATQRASKGWRYNPLVEEFKPRQKITAPSTDEQISPTKIEHSINKNDEIIVSGNAESQPMLNPHCNSYMNSDSYSSSAESLSKADDLAFCKARMQELEIELARKDSVLQEYMKKEQELYARENNNLQKHEWYEHKLRLLKQDKRRRGETIGKLLKSIDEMKDGGKIDISRAVEERAILTTTLSSRGLPHEERIKLVISETQRSPRLKDALTLSQLAATTTDGSTTWSGADEQLLESLGYITAPQTHESLSPHSQPERYPGFTDQI